MDRSTEIEPPCIGLDPDTDPCPFCGASLCQSCGGQGRAPEQLAPEGERKARGAARNA